MTQAIVFISYTSRDDISKEMSKSLFNALTNAGFKPWRDVRSQA